MGKKNQFECIFVSNGAIIEDFFNGGLPYRYNIEKLAVDKMGYMYLGNVLQ